MDDLGQFSPHTQRLRRNALIVGLIAIVIEVFGVTLGKLNVGGMEIEGAGTTALKTALFFVVLYNLCAFVWYAIVEMLDWRLKKHIARRKDLSGNLTAIRKGLEAIREGQSDVPDYQKTVDSILDQMGRYRARENTFNWSLTLRVAVLDFGLCLLITIPALASLLGLFDLSFLAGLFERLFV